MFIGYCAQFAARAIELASLAVVTQNFIRWMCANKEDEKDGWKTQKMVGVSRHDAIGTITTSRTIPYLCENKNERRQQTRRLAIATHSRDDMNNVRKTRQKKKNIEKEVGKTPTGIKREKNDNVI